MKIRNEGYFTFIILNQLLMLFTLSYFIFVEEMNQLIGFFIVGIIALILMIIDLDSWYAEEQSNEGGNNGE